MTSKERSTHANRREVATSKGQISPALQSHMQVRIRMARTADPEDTCAASLYASVNKNGEDKRLVCIQRGQKLALHQGAATRKFARHCLDSHALGCSHSSRGNKHQHDPQKAKSYGIYISHSDRCYRTLNLDEFTSTRLSSIALHAWPWDAIRRPQSMQATPDRWRKSRAQRAQTPPESGDLEANPDMQQQSRQARGLGAREA